MAVRVCATALAVLLTAGCGSGSPAINPADLITYDSLGTRAEIDCENGKSLVIGGSNNTLTVRGICLSVRVGGASERIDMTAPVTVQQVPEADTAPPLPGTATTPAGSSERIAMTAPVTVERQDGAVPLPGRPGRWRVQFTMPREWSLATLPRPDDPTVVLREVPAMRQAVIGFTGLAGEQAVREATDSLMAWIAVRGLVPVGAPQLARYDPPWTLPFLRRNEVMVTVTVTPR